MRITVDGSFRELPEGCSLADVLKRCSPFGDEVVVARVNGEPHRSIDNPETIAIREGDVVDVYPLIIGG